MLQYISISLRVKDAETTTTCKNSKQKAYDPTTQRARYYGTTIDHRKCCKIKHFFRIFPTTRQVHLFRDLSLAQCRFRTKASSGYRTTWVEARTFWDPSRSTIPTQGTIIYRHGSVNATHFLRYWRPRRFSTPINFGEPSKP